MIWKLGRFPTAAELDAVVADKPAWLERIDGHAGWANSAALKIAGITRATPDPVGGKIERDADGNATGVLVDAAMALVEKAIPPPTRREAERALDSALAEMASLGLTGVHDAGIDAGTFAIYRQYADAGKLSTRIYAMAGGTGADFDAISRDGPVLGAGRDTLTVRSVKLYSDGALGSRGAALLAPYSDDPGNSGLLFSTQAEMTAMIAKALGKGWQANVHAIGDRGNRVVLDSFAAAYKAHPGSDALRNRIEHAQVVALDDIPRFKSLQLIASMQPTHATSDMNMAEDRVGAERIRGAYAWQTFLKQGTVVAAGSDFPVEYPNPFFGLYSAVTRQDQAGKPPGGWHPEEALTLVQALRAFTLDAAYAGHAEKTLGTLEPGKWADFIVLDHDIFADPASALWSTKVLADLGRRQAGVHRVTLSRSGRGAAIHAVRRRRRHRRRALQFAAQALERGAQALCHDRMVERQLQRLIHGQAQLHHPRQQVRQVFGVGAQDLRTDDTGTWRGRHKFAPGRRCSPSRGCGPAFRTRPHRPRSARGRGRPVILRSLRTPAS